MSQRIADSIHMSDAETLTTTVCSDCFQIVQLHRDENNKLSVACGCSERSIKVAKALPEGW